MAPDVDVWGHRVRELLKDCLRPGGYDPGDTVVSLVKDIDGDEHEAVFKIERYCGGGFAGQVYRARCVKCDDGWLQTGTVFALKFFSPRSGFRKRFRDLLYFIGFQSPFPHQFNEAAVRTGLYLTKLLRWATQVEFGSDASINDCLGSFWDEHIGSYAELNEWVEGRVTDPDIDNGIFVRRSRNKKIKRNIEQAELLESNSEIAQKKRFMRTLVRLCAELGLDDLARQVYWWTGMSQANLLTRAADGQFVWVDRRPGLPGFLLSLGDIPLLIGAILRGSIPPFDKINFKKLRKWPKAPERPEWEKVVDQLQEIDNTYRRSQFYLIGHNFRLLISKKLRMDIAAGIADYWLLSGRVDERTHEKTRRGGLRMLFLTLIGCIPLIGSRLQKYFGKTEYRSHLWKMLTSGGYTRDYLDRRRRLTLATWLCDGRITDNRAQRCLDSLPAFFRDRLCSFWIIGIPLAIALPKILQLSSWPLWGWLAVYFAAAAIITLPASWQRFFTDLGHALRVSSRSLRNAFSYVFNIAHRRQVNLDWVRHRTDEDVKHGYVSREEADVFTSVAGSDTMQHYITGIMVTIALQPASEIVLLSLAAGLGAHWLSDITSFHSLWKVLWQVMGNLGWWAPPLIVLFCAISPAGIMRFTFCLIQWLRYRRVPYGTALSLSLWRAIGDLAFMLQIAKTYPQFSAYLLTSSICHLVNIIPVFGERGGLLNIWVATVLLSWPASFKEWRRSKNYVT